MTIKYRFAGFSDMRLIQLGGGRGLFLGLLGHLCRLLDRVGKSGRSRWAASQPSYRSKRVMDSPVCGGGHHSCRQFYLDHAMDRAMAGNAIKVDVWGVAALGICDAAGSTEARGIL